MKDVIHLKNKDITKKLFSHAQFIFWAATGAMGDGGAVEIVTDDGKAYYCNYAYGGADIDRIIKACPILENAFDLPEGWVFHYLGFGNHLIYKKKYDREYCVLLAETAERESSKFPGTQPEDFEHSLWLDIAVKLCSSDSRE